MQPIPLIRRFGVWLRLDRSGCSLTFIAMSACVMIAVGTITYLLNQSAKPHDDGYAMREHRDDNEKDAESSGGAKDGGIIPKRGLDPIPIVPRSGGAKDGGIIPKRGLDPNSILPALSPSREICEKIGAATVFVHVEYKDKKVAASGSGFLAFEPGIVLTTAHVVDMPGSAEPEVISVTVYSGMANEKELRGKVLEVDRAADLAVLKIDPAGLPPPLPIKSSTSLALNQAVFICGLDKRLSHSVTIFQGAITNLYTDPGGRLRRVQLASEWTPSCSGGCVVNESGEVVGVSVAGTPGTRIRFAVPTHQVQIMVRGRLERARVGQAYRSQGKVELPMAFELINPLDRIKKVEVEVWTGDVAVNFAPPASIGNRPSRRSGDSERRVFQMELRGGKSSGSITLPDLPKGKAFFWQPILTRANEEGGETKEWLAGERYELHEPLDRRQMKLFHKNSARW
jgi:S1-C subfamily serine protease